MWVRCSSWTVGQRFQSGIKQFCLIHTSGLGLSFYWRTPLYRRFMRWIQILYYPSFRIAFLVPPSVQKIPTVLCMYQSQKVMYVAKPRTPMWGWAINIVRCFINTMFCFLSNVHCQKHWGQCFQNIASLSKKCDVLQDVLGFRKYTQNLTKFQRIYCNFQFV